MPTRLVVWNIERFSINTINKSSGADIGERLSNIASSAWRNGYIRTIGATADIFVVIEVQSGRGDLGSLVTGKGGQGVLFLLDWLRLNYNVNWCVVPPLKLVGPIDTGERLNYTEAIAVFFRNDRVNFTGPYIWPNDDSGVAVPPGAATAGAYPPPWNNALPALNYFAGQAEFFKNPGNRTGNFDYISGNYRRPFLTTFTEVGTGRVLKILSVHPSPGANTVTVVNSLADIVEIQPSAAAQVVVVAGDFNINLKSTSTTQSQGYWSLKNSARFSQRITSTNAGTNGITRFKKVSQATPDSYLTNQALDNIFLRYDGGLAAPAPNNPRIINPVTGTDEYNSAMILSLAQINQFNASAISRTNSFRDLVNFGHIGPRPGTSDHLPLVIDI